MTSISPTSSSVSSLLNALTGSPDSSTNAPANSPGQGILSSAGIGSGLDVTSIVNALVGAKKAAPQTQITNATNQAKTTLGALSTLNSSLTALQSAVTALSTPTTFDSYTAALADTTVGTVSTLSDAQPGSYALSVSHLATAQQRTSGAYAGAAAVGSGTLNISIGATSVAVALPASATLADIATAINGAAGNPGVIATVINGTAGSQLLLSSGKTGVVNGFSITAAAGSSAGLTSLASGLDTAGSAEAQDAALTLNGIAVSSASNTVSGAIDGVTINLATVGSTTLTVQQDTSSTVSAVQAFVTAYNTYASSIASLSSYDNTSKSSGPLLGDSTLNSVVSAVSKALSQSVPGNSIGSLVSLGITRQADGTLALNSGKLNSALSANPAAVQDLFAGSHGYATNLNAVLDSFTSSTGIIATRQKSLTASLTQLSTQQTALTARMAVYQQQLQAQYTRLDTLMSSLNNTSSFLTTTLAQLTNPPKN